MDLRASDPRPGLQTRIDSLSRSFGSVLALLVLSFWYGEAYGTQRWLALPVIVSVFGATLIALRAIDPSRLPRHVVVMGVLMMAAVVGAAIDSEGLLNVALFGVGFYSFFGFAVILQYVLTQPTITSSVILGAICCYLLLGSVFSWVYGFGAGVNPDIFAPPIDTSPQGIGYFSFVTLTTVGYGDIVPAVDWVRAVAVVEALAGQIFLVVLIARLVGMQIAQGLAGSRSGSSPAAAD